MNKQKEDHVFWKIIAYGCVGFLVGGIVYLFLFSYVISPLLAQVEFRPFIHQLPPYPHALEQNISYDRDYLISDISRGLVLTFTTPDSEQTVMNFYVSHLEQTGWKRINTIQLPDYEVFLKTQQNKKYEIILSLRISPQQETEVRLKVKEYSLYN